MLKHEKIVKRLSVADKIDILVNIKAPESDNISKLGVPKPDVLHLRHLLRNGAPMPSALSHSWNRELIRDVAGCAADTIGHGSSAIVFTPGAKVRFSPYRNELSEDPYLASELAAEFVAGVSGTGVMGVMSGYYLTDTDAEMMDKDPSDRVINEFLIAPYAEAMQKSGVEAVMSDMRTLSGSYAEVNSVLRSKLSESGNERVIFCDVAEADDTVKFIVNGGICLRGSAVALETALNKYHKLRKLLESGELTVGDVENEIAEGRAISPEIIDRAVDRIIDLAITSCKNKDYALGDLEEKLNLTHGDANPTGFKRLRLAIKEAVKDVKELIHTILYGERESSASQPAKDAPILTSKQKLLKRAVTESVVLLKNEDNIAPIKIKPELSVSIIGDIANEYTDGNETLAKRCEALLKDAGISRVSISSGYKLKSDRAFGDRIVSDAVALATNSDIVLLFLGHGEGRGKDIPGSHKLSLPANQLHLVDKLSALGSKIIAIIESGYGVDVGFTEHFAGVLTAPLGCQFDAEALVNILLGRVNPSGRLAYTLYSSFDEYAHKHPVYRDKWNVKSGPFVGYRYYDTADLEVGYHFGHGLSYAYIDYSDISFGDGAVSFTLTNESDMHVREVAEVYMGAVSSSVIRPARELVGFESVELKPRERKKVIVKIQYPKVYDADKGCNVVERCAYNVFVGPSLDDIRLTAARHGGTYSIRSDNQLSVDYLQTESNIIVDQYTLEANYKVMRKSVKNILSGVVLLLLAIGLGIYNALEPVGVIIGVVAGVLAALGVVFFIAEIKERNKNYREERVIIDNANRDRFKDAEKLPEFSAKSMFRDEFDVIENESDSKDANKRIDGSVDESLKYINKDLDFAKASRELRNFASNRGIMLADTEAERIFAAFAASRLVVFKGMKSEMFRSLVAVMSEYFDTNPYIDTVDSTYTNEESALFGISDDNKRIKRNLTYAIEAATNVKHNVHIAALDNVTCENMLNYFAPYAKYAKNPLGYNSISAHNEWDKQTTYYIPQNVWFCINLADGESYYDIPDYIAESASVNTVKPTKCKGADAHIETTKFRYYQFDYLSDKSANTYGIHEETWKKIDKLAAYAANYSDFRIENKLCLSFERYATALMACGVEAPVAHDASIAARLLPSVAISTVGKIPEDERSLDEIIDSVFSSDVTDECMALLKEMSESAGQKKAAELAKKASETSKSTSDPTVDGTDAIVSDTNKYVAVESTDVPID